MTTILVLLSIVTGALGNVLIKMGTQRLPEIFTNAPLISGVLLMVIMFPFYTLALQRMNLAVALPLITSGQFLVVVLISYFFLKEPLTLMNFFGILLLIAGLWLVAQR